MIIGLSGFARSGKDEAAAYLVKNHGFTRIAFADKLRDFLYALNPIVDVKKIDAQIRVDTPQGPKRLMLDKDTPSTVPLSQAIHVQDVIDEHTWDHYKETEYGGEVRRLLQRLGTEAGRQTLWDTIWIDAALKDLNQHKNYVVADARFLNEFASIEAEGGHIVRINRAGVGPANEHASEMEALQYPFVHVIDNNLDLEHYHDKVEAMYQHLKENEPLKVGKVRVQR